MTYVAQRLISELIGGPETDIWNDIGGPDTDIWTDIGGPETDISFSGTKDITYFLYSSFDNGDRSYLQSLDGV